MKARDILSGAIKVTAENIRKATSVLASAANKRLRRFRERGWDYLRANPWDLDKDDGYIAGVEKFGVKGKSDEDVTVEFTRVMDFMRDELSTVSGYKQVLSDINTSAAEYYQEEHAYYYQEDSEPEPEPEEPIDYISEEDVKTLKFQVYNYMVDNGLYAPSKNDSDTMIFVCEIAVRNIHEKELFRTKEEMFKKMVSEAYRRFFGVEYEWPKEKEAEERRDTSTSKFFTKPN